MDGFLTNIPPWVNLPGGYDVSTYGDSGRAAVKGNKWGT
jgi:hypothetical protein